MTYSWHYKGFCEMNVLVTFAFYNQYFGYIMVGKGGVLGMGRFTLLGNANLEEGFEDNRVIWKVLVKTLVCILKKER